MSLKDRDAMYENSRSRLREVPKGSLFDVNRLRGGVTLEELHGSIPKEEGVDMNLSRGGVQVFWPSAADDAPKPARCGHLTKKGEPCKANPVKGTGSCIGHSRVHDA